MERTEKFRNEVIAHNLRNSAKSFSLDDMHAYNCPHTFEELYYLVSYIERMTNVLVANFDREATEVTLLPFQAFKKERNYPHARTSKEMEKSLSKVDELISENIWAIPRHDMMTAMLNKKNDKI